MTTKLLRKVASRNMFQNITGTAGEIWSQLTEEWPSVINDLHLRSVTNYGGMLRLRPANKVYPGYIKIAKINRDTYFLSFEKSGEEVPTATYAIEGGLHQAITSEIFNND